MAGKSGRENLVNDSERERGGGGVWLAGVKLDSRKQAWDKRCKEPSELT